MSTDMSDCIIEVNDLIHSPSKLVLLDCRFSLADVDEGQRQYREGHIPGAHYCHLESHLSGPAQQHGGRHPLPDWQAFTRQLQQWHIHKFTQVVVYDDQKMAFAARAWWLLKAAGIDNVRILNGGYQAWLAANRPRDRRTPPLPPTTDTAGSSALLRNGIVDFQACPQVSVSRLKQLIEQSGQHNSPWLIDSREPARFRGEVEPIDPVAGHIPGAVNKPWTEITDDQGYIKPQEFHRQRWQAVENDQAVVYCGSGVTACVNLLSLHLAGKQANLYPGSWSDWCSYSEHPVAVGD